MNLKKLMSLGLLGIISTHATAAQIRISPTLNFPLFDGINLQISSQEKRTLSCDVVIKAELNHSGVPFGYWELEQNIIIVPGVSKVGPLGRQNLQDENIPGLQYQNPSIVQQSCVPATFVQFCKTPNISPDAKKTVQALKDLVGETDCDLANAKLNNRTEIYLTGKGLSDISPINGFNAITSLGLSNNNIQDISPIAELTNLERLLLDHNQIVDLRALADLPHLTNVYLNDNKISDLSPLKDFKELWSLDVKNNQISDLSPLKDFERIFDLNLENNKITNIGPLEKLIESANEIRLDGNNIFDFSLFYFKDENSFKVLKDDWVRKGNRFYRLQVGGGSCCF